MDEDAWYLIAQSVDGSPLGFSHFRFDLDEGIEVLYWFVECFLSDLHMEFFFFMGTLFLLSKVSKFFKKE